MQSVSAFIARIGTISAATLCVASCATPIDRLVKNHHLERKLVRGAAFEHVVIRKRGPTSGEWLHVYIEGDGMPWIGGSVVALDPTPKDPLALRLMLKDEVSSVYVGRPCYFGTTGNEGCEPDVWTFGRYSASVVESMAAAIGSIISDGNYRQVRLIGYSGGGVIALLVVSRLPTVTSVVTVASNLDTDAWTRARGFLPLHLSLNPADSDPLPPSVVHVQLAGALDDVVPLSVTESFRRSGHQSELWTYSDFDHRCCWERAWPDILDRLDSETSSGNVTDTGRTYAHYRKHRVAAQ